LYIVFQDKGWRQVDANPYLIESFACYIIVYIVKLLHNLSGKNEKRGKRDLFGWKSIYREMQIKQRIKRLSYETVDESSCVIVYGGVIAGN